nr:hypothetical protein GCM10020092_052190 [Actinoplanes digitatis]
MERLEGRYRDLCDIEFTIENGKLWMLQTRVGKRTPAAAFVIAAQLVDEGTITLDEALRRVTGEQLAQLMFPSFDQAAAPEPLTTGVAASPGAAVGAVVFDSAAAVAATGPVILVRRETNPDDLPGMIAAQGILTSRGGKTSHAAVVARGMGKTCVCGAEQLEIAADSVTVNGRVLRAGDVISVDGTTGRVYAGAVPVHPSAVVRYFEGELTAHGDPLLAAVERLMIHAGHVARLGVHANADTAADAARARRFGATGVGLCRTEHMFLGERRVLIERLILGDQDALSDLLPLQRADFERLFAAMDGLPVTVRLIDPPLHEFLPPLEELTARVARAEALGEDPGHEGTLLTAVRRMHEQNPMLGLRGVRLGLVIPGLFAMQVRAIAQAAAARVAAGGDPRPEIMVPLVGAVQELDTVRTEAESVLARRRRGAPDPDRHDDRGAQGRAHRRADRRVGRVLLLRHQRPDPDDLGLLPRRRGGRVLRPLPEPRHLRGVSVRNHRHRRGRRTGPHRRRTRPRHPPEPDRRRLRRTRRRPRLGAVLPHRRPGLRVLLAVPRPDRPPRSRPRLRRGHRRLGQPIGARP